MDAKPSKQMPGRTAGLLAAVSLAVGVGGGWSLHRVQGGDNPSPREQAATAALGADATTESGPARLKRMADSQAAPLLDKLKADPANTDLLVQTGNIYYDAQQYPQAVDLYARALKVTPANASVRTDMATAFWYMGETDTAIAEFNKALTYEPDNANTLFNLGLVRWKGKRDGAGALGDWRKLLAAHPDYEAKDKVAQLMAEVEQARR